MSKTHQEKLEKLHWWRNYWLMMIFIMLTAINFTLALNLSAITAALRYL